MLSKMKQLNDTLPLLELGIVLYASAIQLVGVWFVEDKLGYSIGLWYGAVTAMWMAYNLAKVIYDSVTVDGRRKTLIIKSVLRYLVVVVLFFALGYFEFGNLYTAVAGLFGLKVAAYLVPVLAKLVYKFTGKEASFLKNDDNSNKQEVKEVTM